MEDLPKSLRLNHDLEAVKKVLSILEASDWNWTIQDILEQDEAWTEDILLMKSVGEDWKSIREDEQNGPNFMSG